MTTILRTRLYGKEATEEEFAKEIVRLRLGDPRKHEAPCNYSQIAKRLGVSRPTVYHFRELAIKLGLLIIQDNKEVLPDHSIKAKQFQRYEADEFMQNPLVQDWVTDMRTRKGGKGIKSWRHNFASLKRLCNTLKINPEQLISDRKTYETILKNLKIELDKGNFDAELSHRTLVFNNNEMTFHTMKMASRNFVQYHGIALPRGIDGISSGKLVGHGKYNDIHLSFEEYDRAKSYLIDKYGLDSDIFRVFVFGVESCARHKAIFNALIDWTAIQANNEITFVMEVIETKTEHLNGGKWKKYIKAQDLQKSLIMAKNKGYTKIHNNLSKRDFDKLSIQLKELYTYLGKDQIHDGYFMRKPFHTLRHIGAQLWLEVTNWNYSIVCRIGGWHTAKELEDSYGKIPEEKFVEIMSRIKI